MQSRIFLSVLTIAIVFGACSKPRGFKGEEIEEVTSHELFTCLSTFERFEQEQVVVFNSEAEMRDNAYFTLEADEVDRLTNICWDNYELADFDFSTNSLILVTYSFANFGGPQDGDYTLEYFVHRKNNESLVRMRIQEERGHEEDAEDTRFNTIWLSIPKVDNDHRLEFEKKVEKYRNV